ncbi:MAG: hypothetical protein GOU99_00695 [Candidatus Altiarchaeota archaeon]|nr:hypothetical protein [Candidatus Altiarchaeota archaeon]
MASVSAIHDGRAYQLIDRGSASWTVDDGVLNTAKPGTGEPAIQAELVEIKEKQGFLSYTLGYVILTDASIPDSMWLGGYEVKSVNDSLIRPELPAIDDPREVYQAVPGAELGAIAASAYAFLPRTEIAGYTVGLGSPLLALGALLALPLAYAGYQAVKSIGSYISSHKQRKTQLIDKADAILTGFFADS